MTTAQRFSTDGHVYQTAFVFLVLSGWVMWAKPQFFLPSGSVVREVVGPAMATGEKVALKNIKAARADLPALIQAANAAVGDGALSVEVSGDGSQILTLQASHLLLTDKNRPRISRAASDAVQPALTLFVNRLRGTKHVSIEASSDIPAAYIQPLQKYLESYKGWPITVVVPEIAGQFRVRIQEER